MLHNIYIYIILCISSSFLSHTRHNATPGLKTFRKQSKPWHRNSFNLRGIAANLSLSLGVTVKQFVNIVSGKLRLAPLTGQKQSKAIDLASDNGNNIVRHALDWNPQIYVRKDLKKGLLSLWHKTSMTHQTIFMSPQLSENAKTTFIKCLKGIAWTTTAPYSNTAHSAMHVSKILGVSESAAKQQPGHYNVDITALQPPHSERKQVKREANIS